MPIENELSQNKEAKLVSAKVILASKFYLTLMRSKNFGEDWINHNVRQFLSVSEKNFISEAIRLLFHKICPFLRAAKT